MFAADEVHHQSDTGSMGTALCEESHIRYTALALRRKCLHLEALGAYLLSV